MTESTEKKESAAQIDDGGAAFPSEIVVRTVNNQGDLLNEERYGKPGASLRDYFAAHAPVEPTFYFEVGMPNPRPEVIRDSERCKPDDIVNESEIADWDAERKRQRAIQWPYVWADSQIAARKGVSQ